MHGTPLFLFPPYRPLHKKRHRDSDAPTAQCEKNRRRAVVETTSLDLPFWYYLIIFATKCFMSYIVALYHIVFSTKGREATLDKEHRAELFSFIAGIVKRKGCKPIIVNGGVDHVHILLDLSSTMTLSEVVKEIKRSSTLWIKERKIFPMFSHWESEYGAFSVSKSHRDAVYSYIMNQEQHHSHLNVLDEFNRLLAKNYNP